MKKILLLLSVLLSFNGHSQTKSDIGLSGFNGELLFNGHDVNSALNLPVYNPEKITNKLQLLQVGSSAASVPGQKFTTTGIYGSEISEPQATGIVNSPGIGLAGPPPPPPFFPYLKLDISNSDFTKQLTLGFLPKDSNVAEWGTDVPNNSDIAVDACINIKSEQYISKGITYDAAEKISLMVKSDVASKFVFHINEMVECNEVQAVYLYDSFDKSYHDIINGSYEVLLIPGTYTDRFKISFTNVEPEVETSVKSHFVIFQDNTNQALIARNPGNENIQSFMLYDINGRTVWTENNISTQQDFDFSTSGLTTGIYVAAFLTTANKRIIKKLYITNSGTY